MDQFLLIGLTALAMSTVAGLVPSPWVWLVELIICTTFVGIWRYLNELRPSQDPHPLLGDIAQQIGDITGVPLVVFGHTHQPTLTDEGDVQWLNPGSWEHMPRAPTHGPDEPCTCAAKFAVIRGSGDDLDVGLYQWCNQRDAAELIRANNDLKPSENLFFTLTLIPLTTYERIIYEN